jgi:hypothetical protein
MVLKIKKSGIFLAHGQYHDKASSFFIQTEGTFFVSPMPKKMRDPAQSRAFRLSCIQD